MNRLDLQNLSPDLPVTLNLDEVLWLLTLTSDVTLTNGGLQRREALEAKIESQVAAPPQEGVDPLPAQVAVIRTESTPADAILAVAAHPRAAEEWCRIYNTKRDTERAVYDVESVWK